MNGFVSRLSFGEFFLHGFCCWSRPRKNFTSLPWIRLSPSRPLSWKVSRVPLDLHRTRPRDEGIFFALKDGMDEIFDEIFDEIYWLMEIIW